PNGRRQGEWPTSGQRLFQCGNADFRPISQQLAGDTPARELLADLRGNLATLFVRKLGFSSELHLGPPSGPHNSSHIRTPADSARRIAAARCRTSKNKTLADLIVRKEKGCRAQRVSVRRERHGSSVPAIRHASIATDQSAPLARPASGCCNQSHRH